MNFTKWLSAALATAAILSGCATQPSVGEPLKRIYSRRYGNFPCLSVYTYGKQLVIVDAYSPKNANTGQTAPATQLSATIYDPENGLYIPVSLPASTRSCHGLDVASISGASTGQPLRLYRLNDPAARAIFDAGATAPRGLPSLIQIAPPYWRAADPAQGAPMVVDLGNLPESGGPMIFTTLLPITNDEANRRTADALAQARASEPAYITPPSASAELVPFDMDRWKDRRSARYTVGDEVCTDAGNYFGTIERITSARFQVYVVGHVRSADGFFFSGKHPGTDATKVGASAWFDRTDMAHCDFE